MAVFAVVALAGSMAVSAASDIGQFKNGRMNPENRDQIFSAIESGDYQTWKNLMGDRGKITEVINESNFAKFAEMHQLMKDGKMEEAKKIGDELGLGNMKGRFGRGGIGENGNGPRFVDSNGDGVCDHSDNQPANQQ